MKLLLTILISLSFANAQTVFIGNFEGADGIDGALISKTVTSDLTKAGIAIEANEAKADIVITGRAFATDTKITIVAKIDGKKSKKILAESTDGPKTDPLTKMATALASKIEQTVKTQLNN